MAASPLSSLFIFLPLLINIFAATANSQTCTTQMLTDKSNDNKLYSNCADLPVLNSFLYWTHNPANTSLSVAFVAAPPAPGGWVSWGINPNATGMAGAQVLAAYQTNGAVTVTTLDLKSYSDIVPGKLAFDVWGISGEEVGGVIRIFANVKVSNKRARVNHVWQVGPSVTAGRIARHAFDIPNLNSRGVLSFIGGGAAAPATVDPIAIKKNIHGILNIMSWGVLFPFGVIITRYMRTFPSADPAWLYLHISCQLFAYIIGVAGWATGLKLGSETVGIQYTVHRNIGIILFCFATLQVFALLLRPMKDHKYRYIWNIYHHIVGYSVIILGIINIFRGFSILKPNHKWISTYTGVLIALGAIALVLEVITWIVVLKRNSKKSSKTYDGEYNNNEQQS